MNTIKFNQHCPVKRVIQYDIKYNIGLCYGLAPRPNGFTFESTDDRIRDLRISSALHDVEMTSGKTKLLRDYIRGEYKP